MAEVSTPLLKVEGLSVSYGVVQAVRDLDFALPSGSATALVGSNGAGKSSGLLAIAGSAAHSARVRGRISMDGHGLDGSKVAERQQAGISMIPERDKIFSLLTVEDNLRVADRYIRAPRVRQDDAFSWFPRLWERRNTLAGNLSGAEQQMLALGMGLLGSPRLIMIDEPTMGLAVPAIEFICEKLAQLRKELDLTIMIAEADVTWLHELADGALVIDRGVIIDRISSNLQQRSEHIQRLMLGTA